MKEQKIITSYMNGSGTNEIAAIFHIHRGTVQRILKRNNIILRKRTTSVKYDVHYFSSYNEASCYWAGFIAADGNINSSRAQIKIKLHNDDYEHLLKFLKAIKCTGKLYGRNYKEVVINGEWFVKDLANNFGIYPRKSLSIIISDKIPKQFLFHYIRGYFDGDGSITYTTCSTINFTSGSKQLLNQLAEIFHDCGVILQTKNKKPLITGKQICYYTDNARKILDLMYDQSDDSIRLNRKYKKYLKFND